MLKRTLIFFVIITVLGAVSYEAARLYGEAAVGEDGTAMGEATPRGLEGSPQGLGQVTEIGPPLFPSAPIAALRRRPRPAREPLAIGDCRVVVFEKEDVPAQHEGVLLFIGTEVADSEAVPADRLITQGGKRYRKLREGDVVKAGQLLARLDDRIARSEVGIRTGKLAAARADLTASEKTRDEARSRLDNGLKLQKGRAISNEDFAERRLVFEKVSCEVLSKKEAVELARLELDQAKTALEMYEIRSSIDGVIKTIYKNPGEAVKSAPSYEPLFQIWNTGRLRVEGLVAEQHLRRLKVGETVQIEAPGVQAPEATLVGHLQEVGGLAATHDGNAVVSGSLDGSVRVWDVATRSELHVLRHGSAVTAIACSPVEDVVLSAGNDGALRCWNLKDAQPTSREFAARHAGAVHALAFSSDGAYAASGGEDRVIHVWHVKSGELRYRLTGHNGAVTMLALTPDARLVSASRDNTLRIWELGRDAGRLTLTLPRRSGDVARPGVSPDGRLVAFDPFQDRSLRLLSMPEGRTEGVLAPASGTAQFATFAQFAPDGHSMLTTGAADGRLQLWDVSGGRMRVTQSLLSDPRATPTCAAFAPNGAFVAAGTRERHVLVWHLGGNSATTLRTAKITHIERALDASQARIWAELENADGTLLPGSVVTLVHDAK
jgi:WD40 repeat protein